MKLIAFPIAKEKVNKKNVAIAVGVVLLVGIIGVYGWLQRTDRAAEFNLGSLQEKLASGLAMLGERNEGGRENNEVAQGVAPEDLQITLPTASGRNYEQTAQVGEGVTHLARRAFKEYSDRTGQGADLTAEHKVYIEDYIQKKTGEEWLYLGQTVPFSEDLIKEAIESSRQLTDGQLDNLKQYSAQVSSF